MKLSKAKNTRIVKPFVDLPAQKLYIVVNADRTGRITGFNVTAGIKTNVYSVDASGDIEKAWKLVEMHIKKYYPKQRKR